MALTHLKIQSSKPREKLYKLSDGAGLQLHVFPNGSKLWRLAYRFGGKQKLLALGAYPDVSLVLARRRASEARDLLNRGLDPVAYRKTAALEVDGESGITLRDLATRYVEKRIKEGIAERTLKKLVSHLDNYIVPELGHRPANEIKPRDVLKVCRLAEGNGFYETAQRIRSVIGRVMRFGIALDLVENDPTAALRGALTVAPAENRAAVTDPNDIGELLLRIEEYPGMPATRLGLRLLAYLYPRPGTLRLAQHEEFDLDQGLWDIPKDRMKMRRPHLAPLPRQAIEVLEELRQHTGYSRWLLPSPVRDKDQPLSENTFNKALRTMGYRKDQMTAHGFRALASTRLNEMGFEQRVIDFSLAHLDPNATRRAYNRALYLEQRRELAQVWADYLDGLREQARNRRQRIVA